MTTVINGLGVVVVGPLALLALGMVGAANLTERLLDQVELRLVYRGNMAQWAKAKWRRS